MRVEVQRTKRTFFFLFLSFDSSRLLSSFSFCFFLSIGFPFKKTSRSSSCPFCRSSPSLCIKYIVASLRTQKEGRDRAQSLFCELQKRFFRGGQCLSFSHNQQTPPPLTSTPSSLSRLPLSTHVPLSPFSFDTTEASIASSLYVCARLRRERERYRKASSSSSKKKSKGGAPPSFFKKTKRCSPLPFRPLRPLSAAAPAAPGRRRCALSPRCAAMLLLCRRRGPPRRRRERPDSHQSDECLPRR